jgi:hypothetical protein
VDISNPATLKQMNEMLLNNAVTIVIYITLVATRTEKIVNDTLVSVVFCRPSKLNVGHISEREGVSSVIRFYSQVP